MFKTDLPVSHVAACTKEFLALDLSAEVRDQGAAHGRAAALRVIDAPGLGEDIRRDDEYLDMYEKSLGKCDVILWVMSARNRGMALDQQYLKLLEKHHEKMIFALNQVELVEPMGWTRINMPSTEQEANIATIVHDRTERLRAVFDLPISMSAYSARKGYNLQELFTNLVEHCKDERAWLFSSLKAFQPEDFIPPEFREAVQRSLK